MSDEIRPATPEQAADETPKIISIPTPAAQPEAEAPEQPHRRPRRNLRLVLLIAAACLLLAGVALAALSGGGLFDRLGWLVRYHGKSGETLFSFDAYTANDYAAFDGGLAVASVSGLTCYDKQGAEAQLAQCQMDTPDLQVNDDVAMAYDVTGTSLTVIHRSKGVLYSSQAGGSLLDADLSDGSAVCYAAAEPGYKTVLTVLNDSMQEVYQWYSATQYFTQCALSANGLYLAAITPGQADNSFVNTAYFFRTDQEEPIATLNLGGEMIYELDYVSDTVLCAVGESSLQFFSCDGKAGRQYSWQDAYLMQFDLNGDGFEALAVNMNKAGTQYTLITVDSSGKELATLSLGEEVLDLSACGKYLAVLTPQGVRVYDERLRLCGSSAEIGTANRVCAREDGTALLIGGSEAVLYVP